MSEHTPLTEAERDDIADSLMGYRWGSQPAPERAEVVYRTVEAILAARTSTATADTGQAVIVDRLDFDALRREAKEATGLRERVEAELDYAEQHQSQVMDDEILVPVGVIRNALNGLDATAAPTTDTKEKS